MQGYYLIQIRSLRNNHISVQCRLSDIRTHILNSGFLHPIMQYFHLLRFKFHINTFRIFFHFAFPPLSSFDFWFLLEIILPGQTMISENKQQKSNRCYSIAILLRLRDYFFPKNLLVLHKPFCENFCPKTFKK